MIVANRPPIDMSSKLDTQKNPSLIANVSKCDTCSDQKTPQHLARRYNYKKLLLLLLLLLNQTIQIEPKKRHEFILV